MNRRNFLASLLATATLDPERTLWAPGAKTISIPKARTPLFLYTGGAKFYAGDILFASMQHGVCTGFDVPAVRKSLNRAIFREIPYKGNEAEYERVRGVERMYSGPKVMLRKGDILRVGFTGSPAT